MDEEGKEEFMKDFKDSDGSKRLDMWDYALQQQVVWDDIITQMQKIAHEQGIDKKLEKLIDDELKKQ
jgi:uncharacterized protein YihD (DUF1040 family)